MSNIENKNKDFGELLANFLYENGMNYCPFILNSEQANALDKRYEHLEMASLLFINCLTSIKSAFAK